jgi:hypothetical protein
MGTQYGFPAGCRIFSEGGSGAGAILKGDKPDVRFVPFLLHFRMQL